MKTTTFKDFFSTKIYRPSLRILNIQEDLFYIHIGKCGGTTVRKRVLDVETNPTISHRLRQLKGRYRLIYLDHWPSHFMVSKNQNINIACFVRDPVKRLESAFYYEQNHWIRGQSLENKTLLKFETFEKFVLALTNKESSFNKVALACYHNVFHLSKGYAFYFQSKEFLEQNNIRFRFVGELECFESDLKNFAQLLQLKLKREGFNYNTNTSKPLFELSDDATQKLKKFMATEYEIYNFIVSLKLKSDF